MDKFLNHRCILIDNVRDAFRYANTSLNTYLTNSTCFENTKLYQASQGKHNDIICTRGSQNCDYQAEYGYSINSAYDIPFSDWYKIFKVHGHKIVYIYMYLPVQLLDKRIADSSFGESYYKTQIKDDLITFELGDHSPPYTHSFTNWRKYLFNTCIKGPEFTICIEITKRMGSFFELKLVRVGKYPGAFPRSLPYSEIYNENCIIPDLFYHFNNGNRYAKISKKLIVAPTTYVTKVMEYIMRLKKETFNYETILSYATGLTHQITFNGKVINNGFEVGTNMFLSTIFSLIIIGAIKRFQYTQGLSKYLNSISGKGSYLREFYRKFREFLFEHITDTVQTTMNKILFSDNFLEGINTSDLMRADIVLLPSIISQQATNVYTDFFGEEIIAQLHLTPIPLPKTTELFPEEQLDCIIKVHPVPGDGDCLLHCFNLLLDNKIDTVDMRKILDRKYDPILFYEKYDVLVAEGTTTAFSEPHTHLSLNDAILLACQLDTPIILHYYINDELQIIKMLNAKHSIRLLNSHYEVIDCRCIIKGGYISTTIEPNTEIAKINVNADINIFKLNQLLEKQENLKHDMVLKLLECYNYFNIDFKSIYEIAASPCQFRDFMLLSKTIKYNFSVYYGVNAIKLPASYKNVPHDIINHIKDQPKIDAELIIIDIGDDKTYNEIKNEYINLTELYLDSCFIIKMFACVGSQIIDNSQLLQNFATNRKMNILKPTHSKIANSEFYVMLHKSNITSTNIVKVDVTNTIDMIVNPLIKDITEFRFSPNLVTPVMVEVPFYEMYNGITKNVTLSKDSAINFAKNFTDDVGNKDGTVVLIHKFIPSFDININVTFHTGVSGSGKTSSMLKYASIHKNICIAYVAPFERLVKEMTNKCLNVKNIKCFTYINFLHEISKGKTYNTVLFDECYFLPIGYVSIVQEIVRLCCKGNLIYRLYGDPTQITLIDFNKTYDEKDNFINICSDWCTNETYRYGQNIADYVGNILNKKIVSKVKDNTIVKIHNGAASQISDLYNKYKWITFSQENKQMLKDLNKDVNTITEVMGSTFKDVVLYVDDKDMKSGLITSTSYTHVAMTRATREIVIYGTDGATRTFTLIGSAIDRTLITSGIYLTDTTDVKDEKLNVITFAEPLLSLVKERVDPQVIEDILSRHISTTNDPCILAATSTDLPKHGGNGTLKLQIKNYKHLITIKGRRIGRKNFARYYSNKDQYQTWQCMITRYTKDTKQSFKIAEKMKDELTAGFLKFTKFKTKEELYSYWRAGCTKEVLQQHAKDYLVKLQTKIGCNDSKTLKELAELEKDIYETNFNIDFFIKNQPKPGKAHGIDQQYKAGQGVSSFAKMYNVFLSAYFRYINSTLQDILADNVLFATGKPDSELASFFDTYRAEFADRKFTKGSDDVSEFDTTHLLYTVLNTLEVLEALGAPIELRRIYYEHCLSWKMVNRADLSSNVLYGHMMMMSGRSDTLTTNTRLIISLTGMFNKWVVLVCAAFKGDDSFICVKGLVRVKGKSKLLEEELGVKTKFVIQQVPEFCAMILTPHGVFPDVVRRCTKVLSNVYTNEAQWEEARTNMRECVEVIKNERDYNGALHYAQIHYNELGLDFTVKELDTMLRFMDGISIQKLCPADIAEYNVIHYPEEKVISH